MRRHPFIAGALGALLLGTAAKAAEPAAAPVHAPVPPPVVVQKGDTLAGLATKHLGSAAAAGELAAFNGWSANEPPPEGKPLHLPGPEREEARQAIEKADAAAKSAQARAAVLIAREKFAAAKYADALATLSSADPKSRFEVSVDDGGHTEVVVKSGPAIAVEAQGRTAQVKAGQAVQVKTGEPPPAPVALPDSPALLAPTAASAVRAPLRDGAVGPVAFRWSQVAGAADYAVFVTRDRDGRDVVTTLSATLTEATLEKGLAPGHYFWTVRARSTQGLGGRPSAAQEFAVEVAPPRLEVEKPRWK